MSILNSNTAQAPTPLTTEQVKQRTKLLVAKQAKETYTAMVAAQKAGVKLFWQHPVLTPQQCSDALGTDAAKVFGFHGALTECIVAIATADGIAPDIALPPKAFTINQDGTITVRDAPYGTP
jgi:hypothetical protein